MPITINKLSLHIGDTHVCDNLNWQIKPGEFWAILGVNGVGKSTLLHHLIDVESPNTDKIIIDERTLSNYTNQRKQLAQKTGLLLQDYEYNFTCRVLDAALIGRHPYLSRWQWESHDDIMLTEKALNQMNLLPLKERLIHTLSGGEKRRLNIATLLTQDPNYLLLDEPTNHLDLSAQIHVLTLLKQHIQNHNKSGIMVIHDANLANRFCDHVLMLFGQGQWAAGTVNKMINTKNLERLYHCPFQRLQNDTQTVYIAG